MSMGLVRLVMGISTRRPRAMGWWRAGMGCFYGVFYRLAQGTLFTTTAHLVYEDTKCMTDANGHACGHGT